MSKLSAAEIQAYTSKLNTLSQATRDVVARLLSQIEYTDVADLRNQLIDLLEPFLAASTDTAAAYAAEFFELAHTTATGTPYTAQSVSGRDPKATNEAIRALVNPINQGKTLADITNSLLERVDYEIKKTAAETVYKNAERDEVCTGWARVPTGRDTCTFCLMLASRGFAYKSEASAGKYDHFHANCDCRIIPGFDGMEVEGYDPDALYDQWLESGHREYMKQRDVENHRQRPSSFAFEGDNGLPSFENFEDVKSYIYEATSMKDLEKRFSILGNIYGFESHQMKSAHMRNAFRHMEKRL